MSREKSKNQQNEWINDNNYNYTVNMKFDEVCLGIIIVIFIFLFKRTTLKLFIKPLSWS